jgi:CopG family nickel-responsive transcriptional regulator
MSDDLERFGVSIERPLLEQFDARLAEKGYGSRSEALRDLIRHWLNDTVAEADARRAAMGTLTVFYDHTRRELTERLTEFGHAHHHLVLTTLHFHVDHDRCLEVLALKGPIGELRRFADSVIAMKGIEHGQLVLTVPDASSAKGKRHRHAHGGHWHSHD